MAGHGVDDLADSVVVGYRSPLHRRHNWGPWVLGALIVLECVRFVLDRSRIMSLVLLVVIAVDLAILLWSYRVLVTEVRVHGTTLLASTRTSTRQVDLADNPVATIVKRRGIHPLVFADGTWFRVAIQSRDWNQFVDVLEQFQGAPVDRSRTGRIFTAAAWFSNDRAGYFVEVP